MLVDLHVGTQQLVMSMSPQADPLSHPRYLGSIVDSVSVFANKVETQR